MLIGLRPDKFLTRAKHKRRLSFLASKFGVGAPCILQMYNRWVQGADKRMISGVVFLDLSAAFDLVDSSLLVRKLEMYGLCEDVITWVKSYLSDRKQAVWVDHVFSN